VSILQAGADQRLAPTTESR
ncbi:MAG TPA: hypothetical protein PLH31_01175, partial [Caulobacter sp.]|nr:hypothetical protein [Caulobacter sp.]